MAPARDRNDNPYEDPGGYGKYPKRSVRNQQYSPYARPPTAVRNPSLASTTSHANGWLSKLVDPAQRLITSGAHKLFASVFRKRLPPPPPPQPPESEAYLGASSSQEEAVLKDSRGIPESAVNEIGSPASSSDRDGLTELELMLKQKTFTKFEIARLTDLLQSRTVDSPVGIQQKNFEVIPSKPLFSHERKEVSITPVKDSRLERNFISTPIASSSVLDEDVATPAELAKAYMGSRPSEVSPPVLGLRGRAIGEDSVAQFSQPVPSKSPIRPVALRSSVHSLANENGFVTPRSRGRSAIYNMARTAYSRHRLTSTLEGTRSEVVGAPSSSSQSMWENGFSGSKQGSLKRRISVFDSDIGSVGPIRRIRQKSNLLPSSGTLSIRGTGIVSDAARRPSSSQKEPLLRETVTENGDTTAHASRTSSVPSKSSEVASQILQQLDVLVPPRDKSPSKMSPSKLRGPALRSLENVESSIFLETVQDDKKLYIRPGGSLSNTQKPVFQKEDKVKGKGIVNPLASNEKLASSSNGVDPANLLKKNPSDDKSTSPRLDSVAQTPPQKKRAFQMSAHEDFLELDDDDHCDEIPSAILSTEKAVKVGYTVADNKNSSAEASVLEKAAAFSKGQNLSIPMINQKALGSSERTTFSDKNTAVTVADASLSRVSSQEAVVDSQATVTSKKASPPKELNADAPIFNFAKKTVSTKDSNGFPTVDFSSKTPVAVFASVVTEPMGTVFGTSLDNKSDNSSSFAFNGSNTMKPLPKEPESDEADGKNLKAGVFSSPTETASTAFSPSTTSIFSFTGTPANASATNGSITIPSVSFAETAKTVFGRTSMSSSSIATTTTTTTAANSNPSISTSTPSLVSSSVFQLAESEKKETSFTNNLSSSPFGTSLSPITSTAGSLFSGTSSAVKSTGSNSSNTFGMSSASSSPIFSFNSGGNTNQSLGVNPFGAPSTPASSAGSIFGTSSSTSSVFGTSNQNTPNPFGSSSSTPSFGLTSSTPLPSGSSLFGSSATFGLTSSTSAANSVTSAPNSTLSTTFPAPTFGLTSASSVSSATNSTLPNTFPTPTFGSAFSSSSSPSTGFVFGATSSASSAAPSGPVFKFNSPATTTPTQSVFGSTNPNPTFMFGSSPGNNDQMNMAEDSMAEDTVQATSAAPVPVFGQQPVTPGSTGFVFGGLTTPTGGNQNNPFQFGSQPSLAGPQPNQSPFQATGSLEFNAGGSFSLGTGDKSNRRFVKVKKNRKK